MDHENTVLKKRPVGVIIGSVFLTIIMIALGYYAILGYSIRSSFQEKSIRKTINQIDISTIQVEGNNLSNYITDQIHEAAGTDLEITETKIKQILNQDNVQEFLSGNLSEYAAAFFDGKENAGISKNEIREFLEDDIYQELSEEYNIDTEQFSRITDAVLDKIPAEELSIESLVPVEITEKTNFLPIIRNVFSYKYLIIASGIAIVIFVVMIFMNRKAVFSGVGGILTGVFGCVLGFLTLLGGKLLNSLIPLGEDFYSCILSGFMKPAFSIGISILIISIVVLAVFGIILKRKPKEDIIK